MQWHQYLLLFLAAFVAGAINSVAGGGTLITFPSLLWAGKLGEIVANATSTVALWPGQLSSLWVYRDQIAHQPRTIAALAVPSLAGGLLGAILLLRTDNETFAQIVPWLILAATLLFMVQEPIARRLRRRAEAQAGTQKGTGPCFRPEVSSPANVLGPKNGPVPRQIGNPPHALNLRWPAVMLFQLLVGVYGGYFGAGIGILMLASYGFLGLTNIHQMNGLKNINGLCINAVAAVLFVANGLVSWRLALWMAAAAILGGYLGAGGARRIGQRNVRRIVVAIGLGLTVLLLCR
jgi:uncharacterized protein